MGAGVDIEGAKPGWKPQNKTSQTRLSRGTLVEQPLPRKFVQEHPSDMGEICEWPERATRKAGICTAFAGFPPDFLDTLSTATSVEQPSWRHCSLRLALQAHHRPGQSC